MNLYIGFKGQRVKFRAEKREGVLNNLMDHASPTNG
jgi:hypothetical protein